VYNYDYEEDEYIDEEEMKGMRDQDKEIVKTFDIKVSEIKTVLQEIRQHVGKAKHYQDLMNSVKTRDYHFLTHTLKRVNMWSFVHLAVLIFTGMVQVYVVRSLFDDKMNFVRKVFRSR
jgi:protein ERP2